MTEKSNNYTSSLVRDLAISGGIYDCICDPYDKVGNGDGYSSVMIDLQRFSDKIVKEIVNIIEDEKLFIENMHVHNEPDAVWNRARSQECQRIINLIDLHFGVK